LQAVNFPKRKKPRHNKGTGMRACKLGGAPQFESARRKASIPESGVMEAKDASAGSVQRNAGAGKTSAFLTKGSTRMAQDSGATCHRNRREQNIEEEQLT
jgi:hypothetical protein